MMATGALALVAAAGRNTALRTARKAAEAVEAPTPPPFDPAVQVGAMAPLGYFDPLGFSKVGDKEGFRKLRSAEIKHGRVAMMAAVGAVVQHFVQFPGFENVPKGLGALTSLPGQVGFAMLFAVSGALEILVWKDSDDKEPGDFGNPFSLEKDPQTGQSVPIGADPRNRELNNGRMAMFSILGIMVAELATGKDAIEQFGL
jgi:light-harvesting complex I chlorophyll a/b binding protein 1